MSGIAEALALAAPSFTGHLLRPGDHAYEERRRVHNALIDKRPAAIASCRGVADIVDAVSLARAAGLELAVRGGGHNVAGKATIDDGLMIDLSRPRECPSSSLQRHRIFGDELLQPGGRGADVVERFGPLDPVAPA